MSTLITVLGIPASFKTNLVKFRTCMRDAVVKATGTNSPTGHISFHVPLCYEIDPRPEITILLSMGGGHTKEVVRQIAGALETLVRSYKHFEGSHVECQPSYQDGGLNAHPPKAPN